MKSNNKIFRALVTWICVIASAFLLTISLQTFAIPASIITGGFTGVALLLNEITSFIDTSLGIILLNVPIAFFCYHELSKRFTIYSTIQFVLTSIFLKIFNFQPLFDDIMLNSIFGGICYGGAIVVALKGDTSTGGTDFLALYFSNKYGKTVWQYIFVFNTILILVLGFTTGWLYAGYSIIFQFVATRVISSLHTRYDRVTFEIISEKYEQILTEYNQKFTHGSTCYQAFGGYLKKEYTIINTVISSYEVNQVIRLCKNIDNNVIINITKTQTFVGKFNQRPLD